MNHHVVIGTAGHVDHGKSRLVEALTGTHPDRLAEEQRRGITIDLGFAAIELPGFGRAGLVDVPGHERFVRTMVAGAAGVDVVLLVVALDEGVMPQTREHLDVCRLLGVPRGVVALTKGDLEENLGPEWEPLVRADLAETVAGTFLEDAPVITVSALHGRGLPELLAALAKAARASPGRDQTGPLFMPLDRAFSMKGFGTVVTGTLLSGSMGIGDEVAIAPYRGEQATRVRGLQVHGNESERVGAGQRTAVNLAGLARGDIDRGSVLVSSGAPVIGRVLDACLDVLTAFDRPVRQRARMQVHIGTAHAEATLVLLEGKEARPGSTSFVQLHLDRPLAVLPGQAFILRGSRVQSGRGRTIAGGKILGIAGRRRRPGRADALGGMAELSSGDPLAQVEAVVKERGLRATAESDLPYLSGLSKAPLRRAVELLTSKKILLVADSDRRLLVHQEAATRLEEEARALIEAHHLEEPLSPGISKEALRSSLPGPPPPRMFQTVLLALSKNHGVEVLADRVRLPQHGTAIPEAEAEAVEEVARILAEAALAPPRLSQIADELSLSPAHARGLAGKLAGMGRVVKIKDDLYFDAGAVADLERRLLAWLEAKGEIATQEFKDLTGATRRHAIPLSEYFDQKQITLRVGEKRIRRGGGGKTKSGSG